MTTAEMINGSHDVAVLPAREKARGGSAPLLNESETQTLKNRWQQIQVGFVDEPRTAVQQADELVASTIKRLDEILAAERSRVAAGWSTSSDVSTEDLRQALRRYRSFFDRMLTL